MTPTNHTTPRAIVTGGTRGLGKGIVETLAKHQFEVYALSRSGTGIQDLTEHKNYAIHTVKADITDATKAKQLLADIRPQVVVLCAGTTPHLAPVHQQTWDTFSQPWNVDVQGAFHWTQHALAQPLPPQSTVILVSSMAAVAGSSLSGGYAGAKTMVRYLARYAQDVSQTQQLGIRFFSLLPVLSPHTTIGAAAIQNYAAKAGVDEKTFLARFPAPMNPTAMGKGVLSLLTNPPPNQLDFRIDGNGLHPLH